MKNGTLISIILVVIVIALIIVGWGASRPNPSLTNLLNSTSTEQFASTSTDATLASSTPIDASSSINQSNNKKMSQIVTLDTSLGQIQFETYNNDAPNTVANFVKLADQGYYNGLNFHRVIKGFMIQGGDPNCTPERSKGGCGSGGPGYQFADELNPATPSYQAGYKKGVVAMANAGPNTNGSQFFITHIPTDWLNGKHTIFGQVTAGQDVVNAVAQGDKIKGIDILDSTDELFTAQAARIEKFNAAMN